MLVLKLESLIRNLHRLFWGSAEYEQALVFPISCIHITCRHTLKHSNGSAVAIVNNYNIIATQSHKSCAMWPILLEELSLCIYVTCKPGIIPNLGLSSSYLEFQVWNRNPRFVIILRFVRTTQT